MKLKKLEDKINWNGFLYLLNFRDESKCIYAQTKNGKVCGYEVFLTWLRKPPNSNNQFFKERNIVIEKPDYDFKETFPKDEEFGKRAWYYKTLEEAQTCYKKLK